MVIKTIVRIRTNDGSEFLYSKGRVKGFDVVGDVVNQKCNEPETWAKVGFAYDKKFNQKYDVYETNTSRSKFKGDSL